MIVPWSSWKPPHRRDLKGVRGKYGARRYVVSVPLAEDDYAAVSELAQRQHRSRSSILEEGARLVIARHAPEPDLE
jgi:hypothetical protein